MMRCNYCDRDLEGCLLGSEYQCKALWLSRRLVQLEGEAKARADADEALAALEVASQLVGEMADLRAERDACVADERRAHCDTVVHDEALLTTLTAERDEALAKVERTEHAARVTGADLIHIGALCGMTDDEYPLKAAQRVVKERDEARANVAVMHRRAQKAEGEAERVRNAYSLPACCADAARARDAAETALDTTRREWEVRAATSYADGRAAGLREAAEVVLKDSRAHGIRAQAVLDDSDRGDGEAQHDDYESELSLEGYAMALGNRILALAPPAAETVKEVDRG